METNNKQPNFGSEDSTHYTYYQGGYTDSNIAGPFTSYTEAEAKVEGYFLYSIMAVNVVDNSRIDIVDAQEDVSVVLDQGSIRIVDWYRRTIHDLKDLDQDRVDELSSIVAVAKSLLP